MRYFHHFENRIYSGMLKLSVAVHSSFPDILRRQLFVCNFDVATILFQPRDMKIYPIANFEFLHIILSCINELFTVFLLKVALFLHFNMALLFWNNFPKV